MSLFSAGVYRLHSGDASDYKIDCDALTDDDLATVAMLIAKRVPAFRKVVGIPRGGWRIALALEPYCDAFAEHSLLVDDVWTTGASMRAARASMTIWPDRNAYGTIVGVVIFARTQVEPWVMPLFTLAPEAGQAAWEAATDH